MAWITPVTDRTTGAYCTVTDMNRIAGNLDWLATTLTAHQLYGGATVAKKTYTTNDYVSVDDWADILSVLNALVAAMLTEQTESANSELTYTNFNTVETLTLQVYKRYQLLSSQASANHYAGDDIYPQDDISPYSGGFAA